MRQRKDSPERVRTSKPPAPFAIAATSQPWRTFTPLPAASAFHASSTASRLPAPKVSALRSGSTCGSAITCLPFWYLWMVFDRCGSASNSTWETPSSAACAAAESPAGPEPTMPISCQLNSVR